MNERANLMNSYTLGQQRYKFRDKLALVLGVTSTMPILGIPLGGRYITLFTIAFLVFFAVSLVSIVTKGCFSFGATKIKIVYLLFLLWPIAGYCVGLYYMPSEWYSSMTSYFIKVLEYLAITCMLYTENDMTTAKAFAKGIIIGSIANAVWSIFEAISFYFFRQSLNDMVFGGFLGLSRDILLWNQYGGIRVSGFNYDPAHLGGILPILLCYGLMKRNIYLIALSLLSLAFSQSTTALVGCGVVIILFIFLKRKKRTTRISVKRVAGVFVGLAVVALIAIILNSNGSISSFVNSVTENIGGYIKRVNVVYINSNTVEPREVYYTQAFDRLLERGPIVPFTGSGLGTSMYPFRNVSGLFSSGSQNTVTEIETTYIAYLFDLGIVGLAFYIVFLYRGFRKLWRMAKYNSDSETYLYLGVFISVICCSALYHYIFTAYQILAFMFATIYIDNLEK